MNSTHDNERQPKRRGRIRSALIAGCLAITVAGLAAWMTHPRPQASIVIEDADDIWRVRAIHDQYVVLHNDKNSFDDNGFRFVERSSNRVTKEWEYKIGLVAQTFEDGLFRGVLYPDRESGKATIVRYDPITNQQTSSVFEYLEEDDSEEFYSPGHRCDFSADDSTTYLARAGKDRSLSIRVFDLTTQRLKSTIKFADRYGLLDDESYDLAARDIAISRDGSFIAVAAAWNGPNCKRPGIEVFSTTTGKRVAHVSDLGGPPHHEYDLSNSDPYRAGPKRSADWSATELEFNLDGTELIFAVRPRLTFAGDDEWAEPYYSVYPGEADDDRRFYSFATDSVRRAAVAPKYNGPDHSPIDEIALRCHPHGDYLVWSRQIDFSSIPSSTAVTLKDGTLVRDWHTIPTGTKSAIDYIPDSTAMLFEFHNKPSELLATYVQPVVNALHLDFSFDRYSHGVAVYDWNSGELQTLLRLRPDWTVCTAGTIAVSYDEGDSSYTDIWSYPLPRWYPKSITAIGLLLAIAMYCFLRREAFRGDKT